MVAALAVLSPTLLAVINGWQLRVSKRDDNARLDLVAERAEQAAADLLKSNNVVSGKLDVIHGLVNSELTGAIDGERSATVRELALMREVMALHKVATGRDPSQASLTAIDLTEARVSELDAQLADRERHQATLDERTL